MLGETADKTLIDIELQSTNDRQMPLRMAESCLAIHRRFGRFPRQVVVYVGKGTLSMAAELSGPAIRFRYDLVSLRDVDSAKLLASRQVSDNVVGLLGRRVGMAALRRVLDRIARLEVDQRIFYLRTLFAVAGLRGWEEVLEREVKTVPVYIDIMKNKVLGRERRQGWLEGKSDLLRRQLEKKFGPIPSWADERLSQATIPEIEDLAVRLLDTASLDELLKPQPVGLKKKT